MAVLVLVLELELLRVGCLVFRDDLIVKRN